jgi:hypothetical protein
MSQLALTKEYEQLIADNLKFQNEIQYELGDTLDIKTSIALVVIIFLAEQSGKFLESPIPLHWHNIQEASVAGLVIAGVLAVYELFPRIYKVGLEPPQFLKWANETKDICAKDGSTNSISECIEHIRTKSIEIERKRFTTNSKHNAKKSKVVEWLFFLTMGALIFNLATLAGLTSGWRF